MSHINEPPASHLSHYVTICRTPSIPPRRDVICGWPLSVSPKAATICNRVNVFQAVAKEDLMKNKQTFIHEDYVDPSFITCPDTN